jgi:hypothetical protein
MWTFDPAESNEMPDSGKDLGADLYHLWLAGKADLPTVAGAYSSAAGNVSDTSNAVYTAMWRPTRFGGDSYGPVYYSWTALRDELLSMLSDTTQNLTLTGDALCLAATEYAKTDKAASAEMQRLIEIDGVTS